MVLEEFTLGQDAFNVRSYSSLAALVCLLLDHLISCRSEYSLIWRAPSSTVKYIYLFARYYALAVQILNYGLVQAVLVHGLVKREQCQVWYTILFVSSLALMAALDAILLLRVYALYRQSGKKVCALVLPVAFPFVICFSYTGRNIYLTKAPFSPLCDLPRTPLEGALLVPTVVIAHMLVWVATFAKRNVAEGQAVVVRLVVHEGGWTLVVFFAIVAAITPYTYATHSTNPFVVFVWPTTIFSITSCRLIINMRQLKTEPRSVSASSINDVHLSTVIRTDLEGSQIETPAQEN
ncbi:hypothetical protein B0H34DRAFT_716282 [Crassisporium funariophilum]|nr:hypothetical protein B0H34DRAFT_716282 [Crassisporium funariophilum]